MSPARKPLIVIGVLLFINYSFVFAQEKEGGVPEQVNEQLWRPFVKSLEEKDWQTFNSLHTDDVIRITESGIIRGKEYKESIRNAYQREDSRERKMDFWFEERHYSENIAYEVGYYRIIYTENGEEVYRSFAQFHVVLRKTEEGWKIAQDFDTSTVNGETLVEEKVLKKSLSRL